MVDKHVTGSLHRLMSNISLCITYGTVHELNPYRKDMKLLQFLCMASCAINTASHSFSPLTVQKKGWQKGKHTLQHTRKHTHTNIQLKHFLTCASLFWEYMKQNRLEQQQHALKSCELKHFKMSLSFCCWMVDFAYAKPHITRLSHRLPLNLLQSIQHIFNKLNTAIMKFQQVWIQKKH